jgi:16S rRNA (cytidine1402-2'-O)-methyltransferase
MRHSRPLLNHFGIETPMIAYHDHSDERVVERVLAALRSGDSVALISDAGTPLISDPGYRIVDAAHSEGIAVVPIPGACAAIAALSAGGLPSDRFCFEGFLPAKMQARHTALSALAAETRTLVFYEAPHRLLATVQAMAEVFGGERIAVLARELSKLHETIRRASLAELAEWINQDSNQQRGECVLLVKGAPAREQALDAEAERILCLLMDELPLKQAAQLAAQITGLKKNLLYDAGVKRARDR